MPRISISETLDLSGVSCPQNYARALLKLAGMDPGAILQIIIDDGEPVKNVPPALKEEGHTIISLKKMGEGWILLAKRA